MTDLDTCEFCLQNFGAHEHTCPHGEHPSYKSDPAPDQRGREEDRAFFRLEPDPVLAIDELGETYWEWP
jgi:hypothetical protein